MVVFLFSIFAIYAQANSELGVIGCSLEGSGSCDIFMRMVRCVDDVTYKVKLVDSKIEREFFLALI